MLKDELSKLPPFNYYLLFAITCHISLLHSCSEYNKMNYNNLCICFQPAIKIDAFCFQFLILDWRNCWQGCWTEKEYLAEEVRLLEAQNPSPAVSRNGPPSQQSGKPANANHPGYLGEAFKSSSVRSNSADRTVPSERKQTTRAKSSDRNFTSGRSTPPNPAYSSDSSRSQTAGLDRTSAMDGSPSSGRATSSSHSQETADSWSTPKRMPAALNVERTSEDDDNIATPTQAQHTRELSQATYRLDLTNPPSSPFSIKF